MDLTYSYDEIRAKTEQIQKGREPFCYEMNRSYNGIDTDKEMLMRELKAKEGEVFNLHNDLSSLQATLKIKESKLKANKEKFNRVVTQYKAREGELIVLKNATDRKLNEVNKSYSALLRENQAPCDIFNKESSLEDNSLAKSQRGDQRQDKSMTSLQMESEQEQLGERKEKLKCNSILLCNQESKNQVNPYLSNTQGTSQRCYLERSNEKSSTEKERILEAELKQKDYPYTQLPNEFKSSLEEKEQLLQYVVSQLAQLEKAIEMPSYSLQSLPSSLVKSIARKYSFLTKAFDSTIHKISNKLKASSFQIEQLQTEKAHFQETLGKLNKEANSKAASFDEIDQKYNELYSRCKKLAAIMSDSNEKYSLFQQETAAFCDNCLKVLNSCLSDDKSIQELMQRPDVIKEKEERILDALILFCGSIQRIQQNTNERISTELIKDKENQIVFATKIKSLSSHLEEANNLLGQYQSELSLEKNRSRTLQHQLKLLTQSHSDMEKAIEANANNYNELLQEKDDRVNCLSKEIELKDFHIHSLEKLVKEIRNASTEAQPQPYFQPQPQPQPQPQQTNPLLKQFQGRLVTKYQVNALRSMKPMTASKKDSSNAFIPNEENEEELKSIFNQFENEFRAQHGEQCLNPNDSIRVNLNNLYDGIGYNEEDS